MTMNLHGIFPPIATPFKDDEIDLEAMKTNVTRWMKTGLAGVLATQAILLLPSFILAEATLSYVGLGFPDTVPSWGSMLHEASNVNAIAEFPWTLAPAAAIFLVTLAANLLVEEN
jgi:ABC-type dipeptide/oligopeptide/nickel transport system permease subunit